MSSQVLDATQETAPLCAHPVAKTSVPVPQRFSSCLTCLGGEWGEEEGTDAPLPGSEDGKTILPSFV